MQGYFTETELTPDHDLTVGASDDVWSLVCVCCDTQCSLVPRAREGCALYVNECEHVH